MPCKTDYISAITNRAQWPSSPATVRAALNRAGFLWTAHDGYPVHLSGLPALPERWSNRGDGRNT